MAKLKDIRGTNIQSVDADPSNPVDGQLWYNSIAKVLKGEVFADAAWATGGNLNTARTELGGFGTQTSAIAAGGNTPPGDSNAAEEYNGTSWSNISNLPVAKKELSGGAGVETAGLVAGGFSYPPFVIRNDTNEWDGSSWTSGGSMTKRGRSLGILGLTQTSALAFGGSNPPANPGGADATQPTNVEEYDGSSWTTGGSLSTGRGSASGSGSVPAAIVFGGTISPPSAVSEEYNGTSWTSGGALNEGRGSLRGGTQGPQTAAIAMGGSSSNNTELYDGTSWTVSTNLGTPRNSGGPGGTQTSAILFGGSPMSNATEEFTGAGPQTVSIDVD